MDRDENISAKLLKLTVLLAVPVLVGIGIVTIIPESLKRSYDGSLSGASVMAGIVGALGLVAVWHDIMKKS